MICLRHKNISSKFTRIHHCGRAEFWLLTTTLAAAIQIFTRDRAITMGAKKCPDKISNCTCRHIEANISAQCANSLLKDNIT